MLNGYSLDSGEATLKASFSLFVSSMYLPLFVTCCFLSLLVSLFIRVRCLYIGFMLCFTKLLFAGKYTFDIVLGLSTHPLFTVFFYDIDTDFEYS